MITENKIVFAPFDFLYYHSQPLLKMSEGKKNQFLSQETLLER